MRASAGRAYYDRKIDQGKTHNEAMRCRRLLTGLNIALRAATATPPARSSR
jgi:hypothetical protein